MDTRHLMRRVGRNRSGSRWYVRVRVPADLRGRFGKAQFVDKALNTGDLREAQRRRHAVVAEILEQFEQARQTRTLDDVIAAVRRAELRRAWAEWRATIAEHGHSTARERFDGLIEQEHDRVSDHEHVLDPSEYWHRRARQTLQRLGHGKLGLPSVSRADRHETADVERVAEALLSAHIEGATMALEGRDLPGVPPRRVNGEAFTAAAERYVSERMRDPAAAWTAQTRQQNEATYRLFADHVGDAPLRSIRREDVAGFLSAMSGLHRDYGRSSKANGLPLAELLEIYPGPPFVTNKTLNRHTSALSGLWRWARKAGLVEGESPAADQLRPVASGRKGGGWLPFTVEELRALFDDAVFEVEPRAHTLATALPWIMAVALYSGMREGEICELDAGEVLGDVPYFDVTAAKSEAGVRRVPVHSELIRLRFLDYVAAIGNGPLFPGIVPGGPDRKRAHTLAKRFPAYRRSRGVTRERTAFHSFRKNFVRALEMAGVDRDRAALVVGHERGFTYREYNPEGLDVAMLREVVELVRYPGLELSGLA